MSLRIEVIDSFAKLKEIAPSWLKLERTVNHRNITASYDWLTVWWEVYGHYESDEIGYNKQLLILAIYDGASLKAIFPLVKLNRNRYGIKISYVEFIGQQWGGTYLDIIANDICDNEVKFIRNWLYQNVKFDFLCLKYLPEDSALLKDNKNLIACR